MGDLSDDQSQARGNDDYAGDSRHALAGRYETLERDRDRYGNHRPHVGDPENEQDRGEASAAADAVDAEPHPIPPGFASIERQRAAVPW